MSGLAYGCHQSYSGLLPKVYCQVKDEMENLPLIAKFMEESGREPGVDVEQN